MGRYCKICGYERANERFGGRGWRRVICSSCRKLPAEVRHEILLTDEILGFLEQKNNSKKNIKRLELIERTASGRVVRWAKLIRSIAVVRPFRRKRWRYVYAQRPDLLQAARLYGFFDEEDVPDTRRYDESDWEAYIECYMEVDDVEYVNEQFDCAAISDARNLKPFTENLSLASLPASVMN